MVKLTEGIVLKNVYWEYLGQYNINTLFLIKTTYQNSVT